MKNLLFSIILVLLPNLFYGFILKNKMCYKNVITLNACEIDVFAKDMELTTSLKERVDSKIGKVINKLGQDAITANVVLRVQQITSSGKHLIDDTKSTMKSSHISEVTISFKGGGVLHASERTDDMYASIDLISHKIAKALRKHHDRSTQQRKENAFKNDIEPLPEFNEELLLSDLDEKFKTQSKSKFDSKLKLVRPKYFAMPPISVENAMKAMELIDHPFYVFRNEESNEINVLYRREEGGVGLIMPEKE